MSQVLRKALLVSIMVGTWAQAMAGESHMAQLDQGKWAVGTRQALERFIERHAVPTSTPATKRPYAAFDWDDTSVINDVTDKFFLYQIDQLAFKLTPDQFSQVIRTTIPDDKLVESVKNLSGESLTFSRLAADLDRDYAYLYANFTGLAGKQSLEEIRASDVFLDFKVKLYFLYNAIIDTHGSKVAYPWETFFCANMTDNEVNNLALSSIRHSLTAGIAKVELRSPASQAGKAGVVQISYNDGMRVVPEIADLMHTMQRNGIDVFVVSAGFEPVVKAIATNPEFGYNVVPDQVYGLRLEKDDKGLYRAKYPQNYPVTYREGKPAVIRQMIAPARGGNEPIFIAGDSNSDYGNFSMLPKVELGLIVNHLRTGDFGKVSKQAAEQLGKPDARWLLQGVDENIGLWSPSEKTIKLGSYQAELLNPALK